jgi:hypothetical protein
MTLDQKPIDSPQGWVAEHVRRYIETNGEDGYWWRGAPTLILTTLGRRIMSTGAAIGAIMQGSESASRALTH